MKNTADMVWVALLCCNFGVGWAVGTALANGQSSWLAAAKIGLFWPVMIGVRIGTLLLK